MIAVVTMDAPIDRPAFVLDIPTGGHVLSLHEGFHAVMPMIVLVAVDTARPVARRTFYWRRSGEAAPEGCVYVASARRGLNFLHLFEGNPPAVPA